MFNVKHNECVGFESRWKVKKVSSVGTTQTVEYSTLDVETNTSDQKNIEVQTDVEERTVNSTTDEEKLAKWLKEMYPGIKKELDDASNSKAFKGYQLSSDLRDASSKLMQSINLYPDSDKRNIQTSVSALSWNCTGNTLAVSCSHGHKSWCYHEGFVALYSLSREDLLLEMPKTKLITESCIMVLQFHSTLPSLIAVGLFSGDIIIWNIQHEGGEITAKVSGHKDGVTQLSWINDINSVKNILLASSGLDGLLKLWNYNSSSSDLIIKEKYKIKSPVLSKMTRIGDASKELDKKVVRGVTCFDFSPHIADMFVVGAEGGLVVQCSVLGTTKLKGSTAEEPLLDAVIKYYEPHKGEIISIAFSPNRKEMFMTNGSDAEIRIYLIGQEEPAKIIFLKNSLNYITWILYEEKIIAGCGVSGRVEIFSLLEGKSIENAVKEKVSSCIMTQMKINRRTNIVVVGNEKGLLQLWKIPWNSFANLTA